MSEISVAQRLEERLRLVPDTPDGRARRLAIYAAAIALATEEAMSRSVVALKSAGIARDDMYEIVLQSYLFLGFPRMLIAAENLAENWPNRTPAVRSSSCADFENWKDRGADLYSKVYGNNADRLQERVMSFAPEIFEWMILEGYGKVLARTGLDIATRELAIVAFLTVDHRPKQLDSHIRGALRVGVTSARVNDTISDLEPVAPEGALHARRTLSRLGDMR